MITYEVRNALGRVVYTSDAEDLALRYAQADPNRLGPLSAYAVERITRERLITAPSVVQFRGARGFRAGRGRS